MSPVVVLTFPDFSLFKQPAQITFYSPYGKKRDSADQQIKMTYDYMTIARTWLATRKVLGIAFAYPHYNWFLSPTQEPNHQPKAAAGGDHHLPDPPPGLRLVWWLEWLWPSLVAKYCCCFPRRRVCALSVKGKRRQTIYPERCKRCPSCSSKQANKISIINFLPLRSCNLSYQFSTSQKFPSFLEQSSFDFFKFQVAQLHVVSVCSFKGS